MNALIDSILVEPRLHHVGIVVPGAAQAAQQMKRLGLVEDYRGRVEAWDVLCIFARPAGGSPIEFVVPGEGSVLRGFNQGLGGLHHLAFVVPDLRAASERFAAAGVRLVSPEPVRGAGRFLCNFLPPIYTRGYAVELIEELPPDAA